MHSGGGERGWGEGGCVTPDLNYEKREGAREKGKPITVDGATGKNKTRKIDALENGSHGKEVEAGVELRLGGEVQVLRADDGARES